MRERSEPWGVDRDGNPVEWVQTETELRPIQLHDRATTVVLAAVVPLAVLLAFVAGWLCHSAVYGG